MFVRGPVAMSSTSPGRSRAEPTMSSTAERVEGRRNRLESVLVEEAGPYDTIEADQASASGR